MTIKEKQIVKHFGYTTFVVYYYILSNANFTNKDIEFELDLSKQSRFRALKRLKEANVININQRSNRTFQVLDESKWKITNA